MADKKLSYTLSLADQLSDPANKATKGLVGMVSQMSASAGAVRQLQKAQEALAKTFKLEAVTAKGKAGLLKLQATIEKTKSSSTGSAKDVAQINALELAYRNQRQTLAGQLREFHNLRNGLTQAGINTRNYGQEQRKLCDEINRTGGALNKQVSGVNNSAKAFESAAKKREKMQGIINSAALGGQAMLTVGNKAMSVLANPIDEMKKSENNKSMFEEIGVSNKGIDALTGKAEEMQKTYAGITTDTFAAVAIAVKEGASELTDNQLVKITESAALASKTMHADPAKMGGTFARAFQNRNEKEKQLSPEVWAAQFGAALASTRGKFALQGEQLFSALDTASATLSASGIGMNEQLAMIGELTKKTKDSSKAAAMLEKLDIKFGAKADAEFSKRGINIRTVDEKTGKQKPFADILNDLKNRYGPNLNADVEKGLGEIFGEKAMPALKLMLDLGDKIKQSKEDIDNKSKKGNALPEEIAKNADKDPAAQLELLAQNTRALNKSIGDALVPALDAVLPLVNGFVKGLVQITKDYPSFTTALTIGVGGLGVFAVAGGTATLALSGLSTAILTTGLAGKFFGISGVLGRFGGGASALIPQFGSVGDSALAVNKGLVKAGDGLGNFSSGLDKNLARIGAAVVAWEIGSAIGGKIYENMDEQTQTDLGHGLSTFGNFLGITDVKMHNVDFNRPYTPAPKNNAEALLSPTPKKIRDEAVPQIGNTLPTKTLTQLPPPSKSLSNNQQYHVTNNFTTPINDPQSVARAVQESLIPPMPEYLLSD